MLRYSINQKVFQIKISIKYYKKFVIKSYHDSCYYDFAKKIQTFKKNTTKCLQIEICILKKCLVSFNNYYADTLWVSKINQENFAINKKMF